MDYVDEKEDEPTRIPEEQRRQVEEELRKILEINKERTEKALKDDADLKQGEGSR